MLGFGSSSRCTTTWPIRAILALDALAQHRLAGRRLSNTPA
jgi:hypothetical protein